MCGDLLMLRGTCTMCGDLLMLRGTCTMCSDLLMLRRRVQCVVTYSCYGGRVQCVVTYWCYRGLVESIVAHSRFVFVVDCLHQLVLVCSLILLISLSLPLCLLCLRQQKQLFAGQKRGKPIKNREKNDFREGKLTKLDSHIL